MGCRFLLFLSWMEARDFVQCGWDFTLCVDAFGDLWSFGNGENGQLGHGNSRVICLTPRKVEEVHDIISFSCGSAHCCCVDANGDVWSFGLGSNGRLGEDGCSERRIPRVISRFADVVSVSCGKEHTLCLDVDGKVWSFGGNNFGQLGRLGEHHATPKGVMIDEVIRYVDCGLLHSACVGVSGSVWMFGWNSSGQLGLGDFSSRFEPVKVPEFAEIVQLSCGQNHTLCVDSNGKVWGFGRNNFGQLGLG